MCVWGNNTHIKSAQQLQYKYIMDASGLTLDSLDENIQSFKLKKPDGPQKLMACFPISVDTVLYVEEGVLLQAAYVRKAMCQEKQVIY